MIKPVLQKKSGYKALQRHFTSGKMQESRSFLITLCSHKGELLRKHKDISLF